MNIDLKSCPFCGELPDVYFRIKQGISHNAGYICVICRKCDYCFASSDVEAGTPFYRLLAAYEEITEKWDRRAKNETWY